MKSGKNLKNLMAKILSFKKEKNKIEEEGRKPQKIYECKWNSKKQRLESVSFKEKEDK